MTSLRPVTFASGRWTLEGILHLPEASPPLPAAVVCHPHPAYGGDMHSVVVTAICDALTSAGTAALRFNFRGVGRSEGRHEGGVGERDDVRFALTWLAGQPEVDAARLALVGYSFGALVAAASGAAVRALALVSPPAAHLVLETVAPNTPLLVVAGEDDFIAPADSLQRAIDARPGAALRLVEGEDHFWGRRAAEMARWVATFIAAACAKGT